MKLLTKLSNLLRGIGKDEKPQQDKWFGRYLAQAAFERVNEKAMLNIDAQINRKVTTITGAEIDRRVAAAMETVLKVAKA